MKRWIIPVAIVLVIIIVIAWYYFGKMEKKLPKYLKSSQRLIDAIKEHEGFRSMPYKDDDSSTARTEYSIGYGHQIKVGEEWMLQGITERQAEELLKDDLLKYEAGVARVVLVPVSQGLFDALVDIFYGMGIGAMSNSTLVGKINEDAPVEDIAAEFRRWVYDDGKVLNALVKIREKNISWFV